MRTPAGFAMILVVAGATASAAPDKEEVSGRVSYTEDRGSRSDAPRRPAEWIEIAEPTTTAHGRMFFIVGKDLGELSQLRIDAAKGKTVVKTVTVHFTDGTAKTIRVERTLARKGQRYVVIPLGAARTIERIVVTTARRTRGEYAIYGSSSEDGDVASR